MIEDLRTLLAAHAEELPDNPTRVADVHARISGIRRRRTVAATLALALIVAAGVLFTRLPGKPETLPVGVPAGPYFGDDGRQQAVRGFLGEQYFSFRGDATWSVSDRGAPAVLVARCDHRGDVALRNLTGPPFAEQRLNCRVPSGDHFEGALPLTADQARLLLAGGGGNNVAVRPSSGGDWTVGVLSPKFPDTMARVEVSNGLTGFDGSAGGTIRQVAPDFVQTRGLGVTVFCVRGVRLELRVSGRPLTTVSCDDDAQVVAPGLVSVVVPDRVATAAGMVPGRPVTVDVRSVGRQTGQWTVAIN